MDNYEEKCKIVKKANELLLKEFESFLESNSLAPKTIADHISNIDFYVNEYLLYEDIIEAKDGALNIDMFLGDWFIRKTMWASQSSIKNNTVSLKKFYRFLHKKGLIDKEELNSLKLIIKEGLPEWLKILERFDNSVIEFEDIWDI